MTMTPEQKARIEKEAQNEYTNAFSVLDEYKREAYIKGAFAQLKHDATELAALREELEKVKAELERVEKSHYETMTKNDVKIQRLESDLAAARKELEELKRKLKYSK